MLSLPPQVRVFLCTRSTDLRKSFDGLSGVVSEMFAANLLSGHLFVFVNRRRDRVKILYWDHDGLCLWYKKLETEDDRMFGFTEVGRPAHNGRLGPVEAGRMV